MYKIYFQQKPLFITEDANEELKPFLSNPGSLVLREDTEAKCVIQKMQEKDVVSTVIITKEPRKAFDDLKKEFTLVQAGGGFVYTDKKEALFIYRRGKWDLPKGKLDEGETIEECSVREVAEETGIENIVLQKHLVTTYHTYFEKGEHILKESLWYLMKADWATPLQPQTEEDIEKCEWVPFKKLYAYLDNTHPSIIDVVKKAVNELS